MDIRASPSTGVLVGEAVDIAAEYYVCILVERRSKCPLLMLSRAGAWTSSRGARDS
jgi:succinyl-CoA synthetase beta subunit